MNNTILKITWSVLFLCLAAFVLPAQSLLDNDFYRKAKDLLAKSQAALQVGEYDSAESLAAEARENLAKSDEYVAAMILFYRANGWLSQAKDRIAYAKGIRADINYKQAYDKAVSDADAAKAALDAREYQDSIDLSRSALASLQDIVPQAVAEGPAPLPEYYTVRLLLPRRDCFWRIAEYPFVYNNPWEWKRLYAANKDILEDPDNPDLIEVGMRFIIPSLNGEERTGDYDPEGEYPAPPSR